MSKRKFVLWHAVALYACAAPSSSFAACARTVPTDPPVAQNAAPDARAPVSATPVSAAVAVSDGGATGVTAPSPPPPVALPLSARTDGAHELVLAPGRSIFYARPRDLPTSAAGAPPWRLIGHLHGICYPPSYSAGKWLGAAIDTGVLVAPTGNAHCGDADVGPPSWEASTWEELVAAMDADLERSIAKVEAKHPRSIRREGAVLTGFSRGAFAAPVIARMHPKRWPYLVLIEANAPLSAATLRKAGVRAVALVAGEVGNEIAGERKSEAELARAGFPVKLFVMPRVGHLYSDDMDRIMADALAFVLSHEHDDERDGGDAGSTTP
jgi:hypothetical protein